MEKTTDPLKLHGGPGVIAISAQVLQGLTFDPTPTPVDVLAGSIYLYNANEFVHAVKASENASADE